MAKKKGAKKNPTTVLDASFLDKNGKEVNLTEVITEDDCWYVEREGRHALSHRAIKKLADIAGISKTYDVDESENVIPSYRNELEHIVRVTIHCLAKKKGQRKGCQHNELESKMTVTGESNRVNTPVLGRGYLRKMAEKRAYDIGVLEHIGLHTTTFSEDESEAMMGRKVEDVQSVEIMSTDMEGIKEDINLLLLARDKKALNSAVAKIVKKKENKEFNKVQWAFLDRIMERRKTELEPQKKESTIF